MTLQDPQVGEALRAFITVRYEAAQPDADAVIQRLNVTGFPTLLVLGPDGAEWDEPGPGGAPADFVKDLARIRAGTDTLPSLRSKLVANPADAEAMLELASKLSNRHADESIELCKRLAERVDPDDRETRSKVLFLHGYAESNRGGSALALDLWERVITEHPGSKGAADAAVFCTNVLFDVPPERGFAFLTRVLPLVDAEAREALEDSRGHLYLKLAEAACLRRGEAAGEHAELLNMAAWECFERGWHTEKALGWARKAVDLSGRDPNILDTLAQLLFRSGALEEAIRTEEEAAARVEDPTLRLEFEEHVAAWKAVKALREARAQRSQR